MKQVLSFILRMLILLNAFVIFFQTVAVIEGNSGLVQGIITVLVCAFLLKTFVKYEKMVQNIQIKVKVKTGDKYTNKLKVA